MKLKLFKFIYKYICFQQQKKEQKSMCITGSRSDARDNGRNNLKPSFQNHARFTNETASIRENEVSGFSLGPRIQWIRVLVILLFY